MRGLQTTILSLLCKSLHASSPPNNQQPPQTCIKIEYAFTKQLKLDAADGDGQVFLVANTGDALVLGGDGQASNNGPLLEVGKIARFEQDWMDTNDTNGRRKLIYPEVRFQDFLSFILSFWYNFRYGAASRKSEPLLLLF